MRSLSKPQQQLPALETHETFHYLLTSPARSGYTQVQACDTVRHLTIKQRNIRPSAVKKMRHLVEVIVEKEVVIDNLWDARKRNYKREKEHKFNAP